VSYRIARAREVIDDWTRARRDPAGEPPADQPRLQGGGGVTGDAFDELVEPLRASRLEACAEFLEEIARARSDSEALLPWQGLQRSWGLLDGGQRAELKRRARRLLLAGGVADADRKLAAVTAIDD